MSERRSMGDALALDPDKLAFIHADKTGAESGRMPEKVQVADRTPAKTRPASEETAPSHVRIRRRGRKPKVAQPEPPLDTIGGAYSGDLPPLLVSLTTRLSPATAEALRRAALEQRLHRRRPHTQQEIVEAAVRHWLKTNGFVRSV
jgi:hypothetical protein